MSYIRIISYLLLSYLEGWLFSAVGCLGSRSYGGKEGTSSAGGDSEMAFLSNSCWNLETMLCG